MFYVCFVLFYILFYFVLLCLFVCFCKKKVNYIIFESTFDFRLSTFDFRLSTFDFRPFDLSTFRPFDLSTFRTFDLSTFRTFDLSTFRPFESCYSISLYSHLHYTVFFLSSILFYFKSYICKTNRLFNPMMIYVYVFKIIVVKIMVEKVH
jgi:hypothetical protein